MLRHQLEEAPKTCGMTMAYAPFALDAQKRFFAPYVFPSPQGFKLHNLDRPSYDYLAQDWYLVLSLLARPAWAEPYFDEGDGEAVMTTCSSPVEMAGTVLGVITADVNLQILGQEVRNLAVGPKGYAFLITHQGTFLAAPEEAWVMRVKDWWSGRPAWLAYAPVAGPGWSLGGYSRVGGCAGAGGVAGPPGPAVGSDAHLPALPRALGSSTSSPAPCQRASWAVTSMTFS